MSPRNKSSQWILGIVCCCLFASTASVGWGQDYLDLPDDPSDSGPTMTDRFLSLKDRFRREAKPQAEKSAQRSKPRAPRYRNTSRSSAQAQRTRRSSKSASQQPRQSAPTQRIANGHRINNGIVSRPKSNDLLPDSQLFSRSKQQSRSSQPLTQTPKRKANQLMRSASLPRAGSTKSKAAPKRIARKSPTTSRANELDAALADLLHTQPAPKRSATASPSIKPAKQALTRKPTRKPTRNSPKLSVSVPSNSFDLRKALLEDEEDSIASAVAKATEIDVDVEADSEAVTNTVVTETKPKAVVAEAKVAQAPVEKTMPAQEVEAPAETTLVEQSIEKIQIPVVEPRPEQVVAEADVAPVEKEAVVAQPVVEAVEPQQMITIATPAQKNDPFEPTAKQVLSTPTQSGNPMRSFQPSIVQEAPVESFARTKPSVLQSMQQPVIVSRVEGPRSILVGREATYQVMLENTSDTLASDLSAEINVPEWAELVDAMSTSGVVKRNDQGANAGALEWKLSELAPRSSQVLRLRLIPRSGRPLQLGVRWSQAPVQSQAIVEVQEPKLELAISGPKEVRFGKSQRYRLTLRNPGTGLTEQVTLRLIPPGGDAQSASTQKIGDLKPGEVKDIDLELTAREAGELLIHADAFADGGLKAETTKSVHCLKPELKIDWRGPDKKYAGTVAAYYFRVGNPGTVATEPVDMSVKLPAGAEFVSASEGYSINTSTGIVSWRLAAIDVREEQFMQLRCKISRPGKNDFELIAKTSDGELNDSKAFQTDVVALADLKLEVTDPQGPLPLGESVVYEIRVRNRGTTGAESINIIGLFSEGIDPTTVEGAQFTVRDGRVSFHPIKSLPAGREVLLRIHAKASQAGTHVFRTEVNCPKLDIKLAAEETTRFFEDEHRWEDGETPYMAERQSTTKR